MDFLPYARQSVNEDDVEAVVSVLRSDYLTQGPIVPEFESSVSNFCGASNGVAVSSGTAGLHIALKAMGVGHGDHVWTSPITFVASANAARYCGAKVDFVDVKNETANLDPEQLREKLIRAEREGVLPKVVIPVHFGGQPCDIPAIAKLSREFGFKILEDGAHALGADQADGRRVGSCSESEATMLSFHPVKIITSGEGGMVLTQDAGLAEQMSELRSHGITRNSSRMIGEDPVPWYYEQLDLGYHYRLTDIQAALGLSQMKRLEQFIQRRRELADLYEERLRPLCDQLVPLERDGRVRSSWHLFVIQLQLDRTQNGRREIFESLRSQGIGVNVHYIPVHHQPDFEKLGFRRGMYPEAERYYERCISLPMFPGMRDEDVERVVSSLVVALGA